MNTPQKTEKTKDFIIKKSRIEGLGLFALRDFRRGEHIYHIDLTKLEKFSLKEEPRLEKEHPELNFDHSDYVGHGKYVVDDSPASYMNHSCDPNCYYKMRTIAVKDVYALRDIRKGEELTHDVTATSVDQFAERSRFKGSRSWGQPRPDGRYRTR